MCIRKPNIHNNVWFPSLCIKFLGDLWVGWSWGDNDVKQVLNSLNMFFFPFSSQISQFCSFFSIFISNPSFSSAFRLNSNSITSLSIPPQFQKFSPSKLLCLNFMTFHFTSILILILSSLWILCLAQSKFHHKQDIFISNPSFSSASISITGIHPPGGILSAAPKPWEQVIGNGKKR